MYRISKTLSVLAVAAATLALGTDAHAALIDVNLTKSGAPSAAGFTDWQSGDNSLPTDLTIGSYTLSAPSAGINSGTTLRSIDRGGNDGYGDAPENEPLPNLTQTWWGQRESSTGSGGFITIDISGLAAGQYTFTSWHLDHEDQTGIMKIEFSDDNGATFTDAVTGLDLINFAGGGAGQTAENATGPLVARFNFTSTGADVQFRFTNTSVDDVDGANSSGAFSLVNGLSVAVVPEPASLALLGLGSLLIASRRRRA